MQFVKTKTGVAIILLLGIFAFGYLMISGVFGETRIGITLLTNPNLENGLILHYTFDGLDTDFSSITAEVLDRSGQGNDGDILPDDSGGISTSTILVENVSTSTCFNCGGSGNELVFTHTTSGNDRLMLFGISYNNDNAETVTSVEYNDINLGSPVGSAVDSDDAQIYIYKLVAPPIGTHTATVTLNTNLATNRDLIVGIITFTGVSQTDTLGTFVGDNGNDTGPSEVVVSSMSDGLVFSVFGCEDDCRSISVDDETEHWNHDPGPITHPGSLSQSELGGGSTQTGASSVTMTWNLALDHYAQGAVPIKPATTTTAGSDNRDKALPGKIGQALQFNGESDEIVISSFDPPHQGTIAFWFYQASSTVDRVRLMGGHDNYEVGISSSASGHSLVNELFGDGLELTAVDANRWYHVAFTYDLSSNIQQNYIDGILDASGTAATTDPGGPFDLTIGYSTGATSGNHFGGTIDDFRIYNRALSAEDINRLYGLGATTKIATTLTTDSDLERGLVGHWTFDGADTDWSSPTAEILDRSGSGFNGNAINMTQESIAIGKIGQGIMFSISTAVVAGDTVAQDQSTTNHTFTNTSYQAINDMALTPAAGNYIFWFSGSFEGSSGTSNKYIAIHRGGTVEQYTERGELNDGSFPATSFPVASFAYLENITGSETVDVRGKSSSGSLTVHERTFTAKKVDSANVDQVTSTSDIQTTSGTDVVATGMSITPTAGAGDYMVYFSTWIEGSANTSDLFVSIYDNGVQIPHTERYVEMEESAPGFGVPLSIVAYVPGLGASEAIDVRWRIEVAGTATMHDRNLILEKVDDGQITQLTATAATSTNSTSDISVDSALDMTPGTAGDYIAWFGTSIDSTNSGSRQYTSIHDGGGQIGYTEREFFHEGSFDADNPHFVHLTHSYITGVGALETLTAEWRTTAGTANAQERTFVAYRLTEAVAGAEAEYIDFGNVGGGIKTIAFWVKTSTTTASQPLVQVNISGGDRIETNSSGVVTATGFPAATVYIDSVNSGNPLNVGDWHHVVVTDTTGVSGTDFNVGSTTQGVFGGNIDDIRIYNRVLSADEISRLYNLGATTKIATTITTNPDLERGLVGHWTFDGKDMDTSLVTAEILDRSGGGNHGDWQDHATTTRRGKIGQAINFDGVDDHINFPSFNPVTGGTSRTVTAWIKTETSGAKQPIVEWGTFINGQRFNFGVRVDGVLRVEIGGNGESATTDVGDNEWHFVAVTCTGSNLDTCNIYLDNVLELDISTSATINTVGSATGFSIGEDRILATPANFGGTIDDVRVYNRALSAAEILRLYQLGGSN